MGVLPIQYNMILVPPVASRKVPTHPLSRIWAANGGGCQPNGRTQATDAIQSQRYNGFLQEHRFAALWLANQLLKHKRGLGLEC